MEEIPLASVVAAVGFIIGLAFGATVQRTNFCSMGAISDIVFMSDWSRFRAWMLALAVAVIGAQALHGLGAIDLGESIYLTPNPGWVGAIAGGLLFGFGMTQTGGCGGRTLVRIGAGNLKSLIVAIVLGIFAYMTLRGLIGMARVEMESLTMIDLKGAGLAAQGLPDFLAAMTGMSLGAARWVMSAVVAGGLLIFCAGNAAFRASPANIAAGLIVGALAVAGWYTTGVLGRDEFETTQLTSLTFVAPVGESLVYLMTYSGSTINFGIAVVGGVIAGRSRWPRPGASFASNRSSNRAT